MEAVEIFAAREAATAEAAGDAVLSAVAMVAAVDRIHETSSRKVCSASSAARRATAPFAASNVSTPITLDLPRRPQPQLHTRTGSTPTGTSTQEPPTTSQAIWSA